ncbi:MAG: CotH kinase family protein, partial [Atopostipes sp.]|nr:CotH kinase family protein [Atopostipes sp.]
LITDPDNLFDEEIGIYTEENAFNSGSDWERPVHVEYFEPDGGQKIKQDAGLRIHGGATRKNAQKSLRLYAKNEYSDKNIFSHDFFDSLEKRNNTGYVKSFKRLNLRAAGDGWYRTMFDDAFMQSLVAPLGSFDTQAYKPSVIFLNGEYYGIQNIRERYDRYYYQSHYDIDPEDLVVLKGNARLSEGKNKDVYHYKNMLDNIERNPLNIKENYEWLKTMIDLDSFRDYFVTEIYFGNADWPHNNIRFWRKTTDSYEENAPYGHDGRWRWSMYDTDAGFYFKDEEVGHKDVTVGHKEYDWNHKHNTIDWVMDEIDGRTGEKTWPNFLFRSVMENEEFFNQFLNRMSDLINTIFLEDEVNNQLDSFEAGIRDEMPHHIERWGAIKSMESWHHLINNKRIFAKERPAYIRKYIIDEFDLEGTVSVNIANETDEGLVRLNEIDIANELPGNNGDKIWSGTYFKNIPLTLEAVPKEGYEFSHWKNLDHQDKTAEITPSEDLLIEAVFKEK